MSTTYKSIIRDGLWDNNPILAQQLAMCPLLAVTSTATNGLGMGLCTTGVLALTGMVIAVFRNIITDEVRIPVFILLIAAVVTVADMMINAFLHDLYKVLGLFIPLIVTNCVVLGRAEAFACRNTVVHSGLDGLMMGLGFTAALTFMGGIREILGSGTLFMGAPMLLGSHFSFLEMTIIPEYKGYLLMILPPGGFLVMAFMLAGKRAIDQYFAKKPEQAPLENTEAALAAK